MTNHLPVSKRTLGFTLLETIIYLALFSILFTGILVSAHSFFRGAEILSRRILSENESAFVVRKIGVHLNSASALSSPTAGGVSSTIRFSTYDGEVHTFSIVDGMMVYASGTSPFLPLTIGRVKITSLSARHEAPSGGSPRFLEYSFVVDGETVGPVRMYFTF